ncbi:MAG: hypothetical protein K2W96_24305 [Gemmataceae bacterium]|nr:hypothetical protein [Gemmataceae bacterium]
MRRINRSALLSAEDLSRLGELTGVSLFEPLPFDEAMLGLVGLWRQGGGAEAHLALAIAETMRRVGQYHIARAAYRRASALSATFWPDPAIQEKFRGYCLDQQEQARRKLEASGADPDDLFDAEPAFGLEHQRARRRYEEERIAAGASIDDKAFFDAFDREHGPIASPVGAEEWYAIPPPHYADRQGLAYGLLAGGIVGMAVALLVRRLGKQELRP